MRFLFYSETFSRPMRRITAYYTSFCFALIIVQVALVSLVTFFHFLLDHDMAVLENWLNRNAWEILGISKFTVFFLIVKAVKLNLYSPKNIINYFKDLEFIPSFQVIVFVLFLWLADILILVLFNKEQLQIKSLEAGYLFISFLGNSMFYMVDMLLLAYLMETFPVYKKRNKLILMIVLSIMFVCVTNIIQPYSNPSIIPMILFFSTLTINLMLFPKNLGNLLLVSLGQIGLFSIIFGTDLVWSNNYSLLGLSWELPPLGHLLCWSAGVFYLVKSVKSESVTYVS